MLFCRKCGAVVGENDMFCTSCSARLDENAVVSKNEKRMIAAESQFFSADAATSETDLTGFIVMGMRLTGKLFSLMGADYYRAVSASGEECIPLVIRHLIFPSSVERDCMKLCSGISDDDSGMPAKQFADSFSRECLSFSALCAAAGIPSLNYRCEAMYSELNGIYHIFTLMNDAVPLPVYIRREKLTVRDALAICGTISGQLLELEKRGTHYGAFSDCMVYISGSGSKRKHYLDCRIPRCYGQYYPLGSYMSYYTQYCPPKKSNYEVYSLGMILYRLISRGRHPYMNHCGVAAPDELLNAERLRCTLAEPYPADILQNSIGTVIRDVLSVPQHEITLSELSRILINSINYISSNELNKEINGTVGK